MLPQYRTEKRNSCNHLPWKLGQSFRNLLYSLSKITVRGSNIQTSPSKTCYEIYLTLSYPSNPNMWPPLLKDQWHPLRDPVMQPVHQLPVVQPTHLRHRCALHSKMFKPSSFMNFCVYKHDPIWTPLSKFCLKFFENDHEMLQVGSIFLVSACCYHSSRSSCRAFLPQLGAKASCIL